MVASLPMSSLLAPRDRWVGISLVYVLPNFRSTFCLDPDLRVAVVQGCVIRKTSTVTPTASSSQMWPPALDESGDQPLTETCRYLLSNPAPLDSR